MNDNQIRIYDTTSGTPIVDPLGLLDRAEAIQFSTVYPGGIFNTASFFIPCDPVMNSPIKHTQRIVIRNGLTTLWEGFVTSITLVIGKERRGLDVQASGYWGLAYKRTKYNRWIDRRTSSDVFGVWYPEGDGEFDFDQNGQIKITPKQIDYNIANVKHLKYFVNGASKVKRVVFDYDFAKTCETLPVRAKHYNGSTYTANLTDMIDGDNTTSTPLTIATGHYLYIGLREVAGMTGIRFVLGATKNANTSTMTCEYYGVDAAWHALTITDGTSSGGKSWAQSGEVTWTEIDGMDESTINGSQKFFYLRFSWSANLTASIYVVNVYQRRAQNWQVGLYDFNNATSLWTSTTAGTGSQDITLSPSTSTIGFYLWPKSSQKVIGDGIHLTITDLAVIAESWDGAANTTVSTMIENCVHYLGTPFLDDYTYIESNTFDLLSTGYVADDLRASLADQMNWIGGWSGSNAPYSIGVLESDAVGVDNIYPVIYYEQFPTSSDYEYTVRLDEQAVDGLELVLSADLDTLYNDGRFTFTTPDGKQDWTNYLYGSEPLLLDSASAAKFYNRQITGDLGTAADKLLAVTRGIPYVQYQKDVAYYMRAPLSLVGTIRKKDGTPVPVSLIRAGQRIRIENFTADVSDDPGTGLTFLISRTEYDDDSGVITVTAGVSDDLANYLAKGALMAAPSYQFFTVGISSIGGADRLR
jgi:hypothetical protein